MFNDVLPEQLKYGIGHNDEMVLHDEYQADEIFNFLFFTRGNLIICKIVFFFCFYFLDIFPFCLRVVGC